MSTPAMRALARMRPSNGPSRLRLSTPSAISFPSTTSRSYSSLLRPVTLSHATLTRATPSQTRPTLPHHPAKSHPHQTSRPFTLMPLLETGISTAHAVLATIHVGTGTPWFLTIPLFALWLNLLTRLPTTLYSRRIAVRRQLLSPLNHAFAARIRAEMADRLLRRKQQKAEETQGKRKGKGVPEVDVGLAVESEEFMKRFFKANAAAEKLRNRRWGTQPWKDWAPALSVFPFWMLGIEALRRMCGGPRGFIGTMVFGPGKYEELKQGGGSGAVADAATAAAAPPAGEGAAAVGFGEVRDGQEFGAVEEAGWSSPPMEHAEGAEALATSSLAPGQAGVPEALSATSLAHPDMATGGCLWFPDLTVADPLHILPFALSAIVLLNLIPKSQEAWRVTLGLHTGPTAAFDMVKWRLRMHRAMLVVAVSIGPLTMDLPAAIHLYWISTAVLTSVQTHLIWRLMPMRKIAAPAKSNEGTVIILPKREETKKP